VLLCDAVDVPEAAPAAGAHDAPFGIDLDLAQLRQVDHDRAVADRVPRDLVAAAANGDRKLVLAREAHGLDHVRRSGDAHHERRPAVDHAVPDAPCLVVALVGGPDHEPVEPRLERADLVVGERDLAPVEGLHRLRHVVLLCMTPPDMVPTAPEPGQGGRPNLAGAAATMPAPCAGTSSRRSAAR
jgi:hypothetical protein